MASNTSTVESLEAERKVLVGNIEDLCHMNYELQRDVTHYRHQYWCLKVLLTMLLRVARRSTRRC